MATKRKAEELTEVNTAVLKYLQENNLSDTAKIFAKEAKLKGVSTDKAADLTVLYNNFVASKESTQPAKRAKTEEPAAKSVPMEEDSSSSDSSDSDSDSDSDAKKKTPAPKATPAKPAAAAKKESSSDDSSSDSDDSSDDEKPAAKPAPAAAAKKAPVTPKKDSSSDSSSDDSSDDESDKKPAAKAQPAAKAAVAAKKQESSSDSSSDDSDSDEEEKPKPAAAKAAPAAKKVSSSSSSSSSDSDSDSDSDDEKPAPAAAKKTAPAPAAKKAESSSSSSSGSDDSSSSDEEEEKPVIKNNKTPVKQENNYNTAAVTPKASNGAGNAFKIYVKGLPWQASEEEVRDFFKDCGEITSCELPLDENGRSSGTAYVKFAERAGVDAALALDGQTWQDTTRWLKIVESTDKQDRKSFGGPVGERPEGCDTVFVGNLPWDVDEDSMRALFAEAGEVASVRFATGEDGSFRGFGHVQFYNGEDTVKAIALAGRQLNGRGIRVDYAPPRNRESFGGAGGQKSPGRGGRGGGRGGFDGGRGAGRGGGRGRGAATPSKNGGIVVGGSSGKKTTFDD